MVSLEEQEKVVFLNSQYNDNKELIDRLQSRLLNDTTQLDLSPQDLQDTQAYLQDKATLFRFLKQNNFDMDKAHQQILDTIAWRIQIQISSLSYKTSLEFYDPPIAYFHNQDKLGRPILFVRLKYFPKKFKDPHTSLAQHIQAFACLVMEMGRKLTWDKTQETSQLVAQFTVVVNLQKAPLIPIDNEIIQLMMMILESRYPVIVGTVHILNFSWLYQGLWSVIKYMLSQEAKDTIHFTTVKELYPVMSPDAILQEMGGNDTFEWSLLSDKVLQTYGSGKVELPNTPPVSEDRSRSNSFFSRTSSSSDVFFDANDALPSIPLTPPITIMSPLTPTTQSTIQPSIESQPSIQTESNTQAQPIIQPIIQAQPSLTSASLLPGTTQLHTTTHSLLGLRMGIDFLTSFIPPQPHTKSFGLPKPQLKDEISIESSIEEPVIIVNPTPITTRPTQDYLHHFLQHTLGDQKGWMYWALLYMMMRGPIETLIEKTLQRISSRHIKSTTIGITSMVAAILGSSLSSQVSKYTRK